MNFGGLGKSQIRLLLNEKFSSVQFTQIYFTPGTVIVNKRLKLLRSATFDISSKEMSNE